MAVVVSAVHFLLFSLACEFRSFQLCHSCIIFGKIGYRELSKSRALRSMRFRFCFVSFHCALYVSCHTIPTTNNSTQSLQYFLSCYCFHCYRAILLLLQRLYKKFWAWIPFHSVSLGDPRPKTDSIRRDREKVETWPNLSIFSWSINITFYFWTIYMNSCENPTRFHPHNSHTQHNKSLLSQVTRPSPASQSNNETKWYGVSFFTDQKVNDSKSETG